MDAQNLSPSFLSFLTPIALVIAPALATPSSSQVGGAQRLINPAAGRIWKLKNPSVINPVTLSPVAYKLMPMAHPPLLAHPDSIITQKAGNQEQAPGMRLDHQAG